MTEISLSSILRKKFRDTNLFSLNKCHNIRSNVTKKNDILVYSLLPADPNRHYFTCLEKQMVYMKLNLYVELEFNLHHIKQDI